MMKTYLVYLAGPITGLTFGGCTEWRKQVRDLMPNYIQTLSPLRGKQRLEEISKSGPILDCYEDNPLTTSKGITTRDFNDVKRADAILVNMLGAKTVSIGTVMEIAWAKAFSVPIVLVMEKEGNLHDHSMIRESIGFRTETIEEGIDLLKIILSPDQFL